MVVDFRSTVLDATPEQTNARVLADGGRIVVRGNLSSGSYGWILSARAHCYRRTITLEVVAARGPVTPTAGVEDHEYEAIIQGELYGRFILRVNHVWLLSRDMDEMLVMPAFEGTVARAPEGL
jgi:hypothetical protein